MASLEQDFHGDQRADGTSRLHEIVGESKEPQVPHYEPHATGSVLYGIEGSLIQISWSEFLPTTITRPLDPKECVVLTPGHGSNETSTQTEALGQACSDYSGMRTLAVDPSTLPGPYSLLKEVKATQKFIDEQGIVQKIYVGQSHGGAASLYLAGLSEHVEGLILLEGMGLYSQPWDRFMRNYIRDMVTSLLPVQYPRGINGKLLDAIKKQYGQEIWMEIKRQVQLAGGISRYPTRVFEEVTEMLHAIPLAAEVTAPVIIVHGKNDYLSQPQEIIPYQEEKGRYIENWHERTQYLKDKIFLKSRHVSMVIADKLGTHSLPSSRPKEVVKTAFYLLSRYKRPPQAQSPSTA